MDNMTQFNRQILPLYEWMNAAPEIDTLSLNELTLPGTHNAGCDLEADYSNVFTRNWFACQDVSFYSQLNRGARALDVRLVYNPHANGLEKFRFVHDKTWSSRTLADLIRDIKAFLERSFNEFIILDFHKIEHGAEPFDFKYFNEVMKVQLGEHIIPTGNRHLTLGQLKDVSRLQRVLVTGPANRHLDRTVFGAQITHQWAGSDFLKVVGDTLEQIAQPQHTRLQAFIARVLAEPPEKSAPWSLSAAIYDAGGPVRMLDQLDTWFDPDNSDWAEKCSIINFDFIKNSKLVYFCYQANIKKAFEKTRGYSSYILRHSNS